MMDEQLAGARDMARWVRQRSRGGAPPRSWPSTKATRARRPSHEALAVPESLSFDVGQHLVSAAAGERDAASAGPRGRGLRDRLARLLDTVTGPTA